MTIELSGNVEKQLRNLAASQGREIGDIVEEAVLEYLEAAAITDVQADEIGESQMTMLGELRGVPGWKDGRA